mgnify:CR=1 FL=1
MNTTTQTPTSRFLATYEVYDVAPDGEIHEVTSQGELAAVVRPVAVSGLPRIVDDRALLPEEIAAVLAFPIYRDGQIVSVVAFAAATQPGSLGVFEIWEPHGEFEEVKLSQGYYCELERFQNVSSFIRFEKGSGLPGLVWQRRCAVVHNDLPNHPGFLRAAGAAAEALTTAVGIPIFDDDFVAAVVLISSARSPLARGIEIWAPDERGFELVEGSYPSLDAAFHLPARARLAHDGGLPGLAREHGGACVSHEASCYAAGRTLSDEQAERHHGLALPYYDGAQLMSVVVLLF